MARAGWQAAFRYVGGATCAICEHSLAVSVDGGPVELVGNTASFGQFADVAGRSYCPLVRELEIDDNGYSTGR